MRRVTACACAKSFQKPSSALRRSRSAISRSSLAKSKTHPEIFHSFRDRGQTTIDFD
jgi:hypothetical protein